MGELENGVFATGSKIFNYVLKLWGENFATTVASALRRESK